MKQFGKSQRGMHIVEIAAWAIVICLVYLVTTMIF